MQYLVALCIYAFFLTSAVASSSFYLNLGGFTLHDRGGYNDFNPGLGLEVRTSDDWSFGAGVLKNSHDRRSRYAVAEYSPLTIGGAHIGFLAGAIDGYQLHNGQALPLLAPTIEWRGERFGLTCAYLPQIHGRTDSSGLAFLFKVRF